MTELAITPGLIKAGPAARTVLHTLGATVTAGQALYTDPAANFVAKLAQCDGEAREAQVVGIALNGGAAGQPVLVLTAGPLEGCEAEVGVVYVLSGTAGGIMPVEDLVDDDYVTVLGIGVAAGVMMVDIQASGVQVPGAPEPE